MSNKSWEFEVALFLLAAFLFIAIAVLAADRVELAQAAHHLLTA